MRNTGSGHAIFVETRIAKSGVSGLVVALEIELVLDQQSARKRVVADTIAANPGIHQRQRHQENDQKPSIESWRRFPPTPTLRSH